MRKSKIIRQIDVTVFTRRGPIDQWHIGVTNDPFETKLTLTSGGHDISRWRQWQADNALDAQVVGKLFVMLGMKNTGIADSPATSETVFVF